MPSKARLTNFALLLFRRQAFEKPGLQMAAIENCERIAGEGMLGSAAFSASEISSGFAILGMHGFPSPRGKMLVAEQKEAHIARTDAFVEAGPPSQNVDVDPKRCPSG